MTPEPLAQRLVTPLLAEGPFRVLEPSFGTGGFLVPTIERFLESVEGRTDNERLGRIVNGVLWGVELDADLYERCLARVAARWGPLPSEHNLVHGDYFRFDAPPGGFDLIVGNPPFGGTFDAEIEDLLDRRFGRYAGDKVKKETYSFFTAKAIHELSPAGTLRFICSDTFLTIKTMKGLRRKLMDSGRCAVDRLPEFSHETNQPMVVLTIRAGGPAPDVDVMGSVIPRSTIEKTPNCSWSISDELVPYFEGPLLDSFVVATGGMTIGRNAFFVRPIDGDRIVETVKFEFFDDPITLERERERARLGKLSVRQEQRIREAEAAGETRRNVRVLPLDEPRVLTLPHPDYLPYNKATGARLFSPQTHVVYWEDEGDAVLTFKRNGPWYLHGVGGRPFFKRRGITWQLVAPRINARYLPPGYILDSGAPCAFLKEGVPEAELWFILAWLQTNLASEILKQVINHTRNIQGKDIERLPYPHWVAREPKRVIIEETRRAVERLRDGASCDTDDLAGRLEGLFSLPTELNEQSIAA